MKLISLGGVGGCDLAQALRDLNQETYPYDWLITTQSFILNSFNDFNHFFEFDEKYVYETGKLMVGDKKAIMLHDFDRFAAEKQDVIAKYKRRFNKLNECLKGNEDILFLRVYDNLQEELSPKNYYNDILIRDDEDIQQWEAFIQRIQVVNKNIKLLVITSRDGLCSNSPDVILQFTKELNTPSFCNIIKNAMKTAF